jgi:hypothetical protein
MKLQKRFSWRDINVFINYNYYPVICFDVTKENDETLFGKIKAAELEVTWMLRNYENVHYYVSAVVESQRIANMYECHRWKDLFRSEVSGFFFLIK